MLKIQSSIHIQKHYKGYRERSRHNIRKKLKVKVQLIASCFKSFLASKLIKKKIKHIACQKIILLEK